VPLDHKERMFEYHGMNKAIEENSAKTPQEFVKNIYCNLSEYRGSESFDDDICIICAEV
jgi:serine phosphatase RsbU (regulator of sigma subunit)